MDILVADDVDGLASCTKRRRAGVPASQCKVRKKLAPQTQVHGYHIMRHGANPSFDICCKDVPSSWLMCSKLKSKSTCLLSYTMGHGVLTLLVDVDVD